MEYSLNKGEISINETILDTIAEQPIDIDFTLPDYCKDINKILKCQVKPIIQNRSINGDKLDIDGSIKVRLLYLDEEKQIVRTFKYSAPFSFKMDIKRQGSEIINPIIFTKENIEYINCRAVSPRRMNISGAFSVHVKLLTKTHKQIVSQIADENVQQKSEKILASSLVCETEKPFLMSEILELAQGKPEIENIIRSDVIPILDEVKLIDDKAIMKGTVFVKIMYQSDVESSDIETMEYAVPISQILSMEGINESCNCEAQINLISYNMEAVEGSDGSNSLIESEMHFIASVIAYEKKSINIVTDAYSTKHDMLLEFSDITIDEVQDSIFESASLKENIDVNNDVAISQVFDIWNEMLNCNCSEDSGKLVIKGKYNICILAKGEDGFPLYIEKLAQFEYALDLNSSNETSANLQASITSLSYRITPSGSIEAKAEIRFNITNKISRKYKSINHASADESHEKTKDENASIVIYYAKCGESIWDIAMKYDTSMESIKRQNDIDVEILNSNTMLLIPV